ncbi:MAG TPA: DUF1688 family protein, partial [Geminicoccaceae bacterium]|nr:DUF1688 family protein [Geminicoccaceae bacterium]
MTAPGDGVEAAVAWLRSPAAIRTRCGAVLAAAEADRLAHFALDASRLDDAAAYVVETIRAAYPDPRAIPYHSRWRHFGVGGRDRWAELAARLGDVGAEERARVRFDLVVPSVLLDAGAGAAWGFDEPGDGGRFARSEGLAVASVHAFAAGLFSADPDGAPLRADGAALAGLDAGHLGAAFQVRDDNPLVGLEGRAELMRRLGGAVLAQPGLFGAERPRIGSLFGVLRWRADGGGRLPAAAVLETVLAAFGDIWPGRLGLGGVNLGDVGRHPAAAAEGPTDGLVP